MQMHYTVASGLSDHAGVSQTVVIQQEVIEQKSWMSTKL